MPDLFFEDFKHGAALPEATLTVTADDAAFFAATFGAGMPEAGGHGCSAALPEWHVAALGMRLLFDAFLHRTAGLGGPGVEAVTWPHPVRVGDILRFTATVAEARPSASRPEMGLVTVAIALFNREGICVMTQENAIMVARRSPGARRGGTEARS